MEKYDEEIFEFLKTFHPITRKIFEEIFSICTFEEIKAHTKIIDVDVVPKKIYLLTNGVVKSYIYLESGKQFTKTIFTSLDFFSSLTSLLAQSPSEFVYESVTNCQVYSANFKEFKKLCEGNIEILKLYSKGLEYLFSTGERKHLEMAAYNAKQRYLKLRDRIPDIDNLIPQYQIASYLNITPVQLSRIRATLY